MFIKCPSNNDVAFKITIGHVIDQIVILKVISLFDGHLIDIYIICKITRSKCINMRTYNSRNMRF
jgi:hypothetical protein